MALGPLQFVVLGVRGEEQQQAALKSLRNLSQRGAIRVIDVAYATKQEDGTWVPARVSGLTEEERKRFGAVAGALIGFGYGGGVGAVEGGRAGAEYMTTGDGLTLSQRDYGENLQEIKEHLRDIGQDLPTGATVAVALIEHQWMPKFREELRNNGILVLGSGMIRPRSLVALGRELAEVEQAIQ
jgi:uncharacterized membrane protein